MAGSEADGVMPFAGSGLVMGEPVGEFAMARTAEENSPAPRVRSCVGPELCGLELALDEASPRLRCGRRVETTRDIYVAGQGGHALLRISHHLAYPIAARLQLKGDVDAHPSLEKLRQLSIRNIYGCVPLLGNHQIFFLIEDAKNKGQRIEVMVPFLLQME